MADIAGVLATGGTALVSAAAGAGLTYWLGALNRRHQEAREDKTRWYEARREAYAALLIAAQRVSVRSEEGTPEKQMSELADELAAATSAVRLVGSPEVVEAADNLFVAVVEDVELLKLATNRTRPCRTCSVAASGPSRSARCTPPRSASSVCLSGAPAPGTRASATCPKVSGWIGTR